MAVRLTVGREVAFPKTLFVTETMLVVRTGTYSPTAATLGVQPFVNATARSTLAERENQHRLTTEALAAEKAQMEEQLALAQQERDRLQSEVTTIKRETEAAWANERMESAVLRERINDVAAEVARLTAQLEGPSSPIEAILAGESGPAHTGANGAAANQNGNGEALIAAIGAEPAKGTLADRIRALQSRRTRVPQAS